ncbi:MAG TPA: hypothetical protein VFM54_15420 [Micromonosporaceae bacterium]|nr:hypothetical protein [Micromonosporaceae bacterium]
MFVADPEDDRPSALISYEDLESIEETLEILSDAGVVQAIRESWSDPERFSIDDIRGDLEARSGGESSEA